MTDPSSSVAQPSKKRLEGKVAIITGGASGIGAATTILFHENGAKVVIADIQDELGQAIADKLGDGVTFIHCDVSNEDDIINVVDTTVAKYGSLDIMYNNAGIVDRPFGSILDSKKSDLERVLSVNVVGSFLGAKHAARVMVPKRKGCILFTASACSAIAGSATHAYTVSKHGIVGLVKNLAAELGQYGIRVNCVSPSGLVTGQTVGVPPKVIEEALHEMGNLKGKILRVKDVAMSALFLASDEADFISGLNLLIDGGSTLLNPAFWKAVKIIQMRTNYKRPIYQRKKIVAGTCQRIQISDRKWCADSAFLGCLLLRRISYMYFALRDDCIIRIRIARCYFGNVAVGLSISLNHSFNEIAKQIRSRFPVLESNNFLLNYSMFNEPPCILETDKDVELMFATQELFGANVIHIKVTRTDSMNDNSTGSPTEMDESDDIVPDIIDDYFNVDGGGETGCISDQWKGLITHVKQSFTGGRQEFKENILKFAIAVGFAFRLVKNEPRRVTAICAKYKNKGCPWRVHATLCRANGHFVIKKFVPHHTCGGNVTASRSNMVSSRLVASLIQQQIRDRPNTRPRDIAREMKQKYGLDISYWNAWYGKEIARKELYGDDDESYKNLVRYANAIGVTNPGSYCTIMYDDTSSRFERLFVSFAASIKGYQSCRPFLCLDGTFLKSKHKGTLLVATGKNGNQGLYPLAFAIVNNETEENWSWFLEILHGILEPYRRQITFISDRNNGLIAAVNKWFPNSPHAYCFHHLQTNIRSRYPGSNNKEVRDNVLQLFTICAYTHSRTLFHYKYLEMEAVGGQPIKAFMRALPFVHWANSYFPGRRYGQMCSSAAESFNSWILEERLLPITQLVDGIRAKMMKMIGDRAHEASKWTTRLCPKIEKIIKAHVDAGKQWIVNRSHEDVYEVLGKKKAVVNIAEGSCSCRKWEFLGFPCVHAVTVLKFLDDDPYLYCDQYFMAETFRECYSFPINPVLDGFDNEADNGEVFNLLPPETKTQPGRPRANRFKSTGEVGKIKCGRCGVLGRHNRRTCTATI